MTEDFLFAFDGATSPNGPWRALRVLSARGHDGLNELYEISIDLESTDGSSDVDVESLLGLWGTLRIRTNTNPPWRLIHGIIASVEDIGDSEGGTRYRVVLMPPVLRATMMRKSLIYLEKTLSEIIDATLMRSSLGAGLQRSTTVRDLDEDISDLSTYTTPRAAFGWSVSRSPRLDDREARPYCVQYEEDDWSFVSRLLEEEGIAYHFEHNSEECVLVLSDYDQGRMLLPEDEPLGPTILGRTVTRFSAGGRVRPRSVVLDDFNWKKPDLELQAASPSGITEFTMIENPGRYEASRETGEKLALVLEQRFDTERSFANAEVSCRLLQAGSVFTLDHPTTRYAGRYLVVRVEHEISQLGDTFSKNGEHPYKGRIQVIRCGASGASNGESNYRPARRTIRPRILGSQSAIVTADPSSPSEEIWVGGPADVGCVRVRFHWDRDVGRLAQEPSSCWVRVSQMFAGANHGAMWHPRVGNEVIVDHLDGDPDRPIIVGRVYNGKNLPPENATQRPTFSCIKSLTSPYNGNYNMLAFEDQQGKEQIILHAAKDFITNVKHDSTRNVGNDDSTHVVGDSDRLIEGNDLLVVLKDKRTTVVGIDTTISEEKIHLIAPKVDVDGGSEIVLEAPIVEVEGKAFLTLEGSTSKLVGKAMLTLYGAVVKIQGGFIQLSSTGNIAINAAGNVDVTSSTINLNC